ncbi:hypothetical protein EBH47_23015 [Salmonella enterica]|nr:hypothetical protein [Salmonella enterica]
MGAQKGAHEHAFLFISFIFNLLCCVLSPAFGTISTSKIIRESPNIPLKSMLTEIFTSCVVRGCPLKSGCHWGHNWGHLNFD